MARPPGSWAWRGRTGGTGAAARITAGEAEGAAPGGGPSRKALDNSKSPDVGVIVLLHEVREIGAGKEG